MCRRSASWVLATSAWRVGLPSQRRPDTPRAIVDKLNALFIKASQDPELQQRLEQNGTPIATNTPEDMGRAMEQEWQTMQQLAKTLNLRPQ